MIWMRSPDCSARTAATGWIQGKDRALPLLCPDILAQFLHMPSFSSAELLKQSMCWHFPLWNSFVSFFPSFEPFARSHWRQLLINCFLFVLFSFLWLTNQNLGVTFSKSWILRFCFAACHEGADAEIAFWIIWITQEHFSLERRWIMSPTSIGFVFLFGILHVCSGESVIC